MNKIILIAGGASIASLAAGAAGGYFYAKNKLAKEIGAEFDKRLEKELDATRKALSIRKMQSDKPDSPMDIPTARVEQIVSDSSPQLAPAAKAAMIDYQGASAKIPSSGVVQQNAFKDRTKRQPMPPRAPSGRFVKTEVAEESEPTFISQEEYLQDDFRLEMGTLRWYSNDKTLLNYEDEEVDIDLVGGAEMLTRFPNNLPEGAERSIWIRNIAYGWAWEITLMDDDEGAHAGFEHYQLDQVDAEEYPDVDDEPDLDED